MGFKARKSPTVIGRWTSTAEGWVPYEEAGPRKMKDVMTHWAIDPVDLVSVYRDQYLVDQTTAVSECANGGHIAKVCIRVTVDAELLGDQYGAEDE